MALELLISRAGLNNTATIAYLKDSTLYSGTGAWGDSGNPARTAAAVIIFATKIASQIANDSEIDLLSTYNPEIAPETSDPNNPTYVDVDIATNGDGIYQYECVALTFIGTAGVGNVGYYWDDTNNYIVSWNGSVATEITDPYAVKDLILSSSNNDGYIDDYTFYDIIVDVEATKIRSELSIDLTSTQCDCGTDKSKVCDCCINKKEIYDNLRLQIEGALANFAQGAYRNAARNFDMITSLITEYNHLD